MLLLKPNRNKSSYSFVSWATQQGKERRIETFGRGRRAGLLWLKEFVGMWTKRLGQRGGSVAFSDGAPHFVVLCFASWRLVRPSHWFKSLQLFVVLPYFPGSRRHVC
jgi:hypothetical protein